MNGVPEISVIVPVYNSADSLCECVESVLKSEFKDMELILVDDGSTDESAEIMAEYAEMDERVHTVRIRHQGVGAARNRGLDEASGRWLTFVDADDYVDPGFFSRLHEALSANEASGGEEALMALCGYTLELAGGDRKQSRIYRNNDGGNEDAVTSVAQILARCNIYPLTGPVCKLFRRDITEAAALRFPSDMNFGEDTVFVFTYMNVIGRDGTDCVAVTDSCGYHYVKTSDESLTTKATPRERIKAYKRFYELAEPMAADFEEARRNVETHFTDEILTTLKLDREHQELSGRERGECYELIYLLASPEVFKPRMPWFFDTFGSFHLWRQYEWLYKLLYPRK